MTIDRKLSEQMIKHIMDSGTEEEKSFIVEQMINKSALDDIKNRHGYQTHQNIINSLEEDIAYIDMAIHNVSSPFANHSLKLAKNTLKKHIEFLRS